jgi:hypothetical protein
MSNEGNQIYNFISCSGSGTVIKYGSGSDFLTSYDSGSGSTSQKVTVPTIPTVPVPQHCPENMCNIGNETNNLITKSWRVLVVSASFLASSLFSCSSRSILLSYADLKVCQVMDLPAPFSVRQIFSPMISEQCFRIAYNENPDKGSWAFQDRKSDFPRSKHSTARYICMFLNPSLAL